MVESFMYRTQSLLGLMLLGLMGTAAAIGPGGLDNPGGRTSSIGDSFAAAATIDAGYLIGILPASAAVAIPDIPQIAGEKAVAYKGSPDGAGDGHFSLADFSVSILGNLTSAFDHGYLAPGRLAGALDDVRGGVLQAIDVPEPQRWMTLAAGIGLIGMMVGRISRTV
jgi:hypothetical protein